MNGLESGSKHPSNPSKNLKLLFLVEARTDNIIYILNFVWVTQTFREKWLKSGLHPLVAFSTTVETSGCKKPKTDY